VEEVRDSSSDEKWFFIVDLIPKKKDKNLVFFSLNRKQERVWQKQNFKKSINGSKRRRLFVFAKPFYFILFVSFNSKKLLGVLKVL